MSNISQARTVHGDDNGGPIVAYIVDDHRVHREALSYYISRTPGLTSKPLETALELTNGDFSGSVVILMCVADNEPLPRAPLPPVLESAPLVILANDRPIRDIAELFAAGAKGFIPTSAGLAIAAQALRLVALGGTFVPASYLTSSLHADPGARDAENVFTSRQRQVIEALREGKPNKIIAYELNMCESTVKVHIRAIMKKLKAHNRTQVALLYSAQSNREYRALEPVKEPIQRRLRR